ncbi:p21-activated protein kinase-interacting protein 1-like isoform X2 [Amphibalanus amphitrite]|uniref:p21-activated protein kinase-interacting protein 1-like isoform X2 n=1 Tax=Amphibalanus amphitrite TaxID=1232801 RepID=UPI001C91A194|nr:p21-activated protein kinase-interacting protein 1-like isoform X2 [Amphibalanus amphitrite]XP_043229031.1 p21-activated protein kinase-interacting protein 1-like isoform X2 [Amphibalanus amphitrite]
MDRELEVEVICGTYEEFVVGYQLFTYSGDDKEVRQFEQTFADHSHTASVRAVACRGDLLASGGADEIVKLYDMRRRVESGQLMDHQGTITCLEFHGRHHLLSGSEDGRVAVVRTDNWQCEKYLGRHKGGVTALAVHPTGRLALTAGKDGKLLTWDLVRGRVAFRTNIKAAAEFVLWSPDGSTYAVGVQGRCDVYSVASAGVLYSLKSAGRINCAAYLSKSLLVCGDESGQATVFDVSPGGGGRGCSWAAHQARLRALAVMARSETRSWIVTASSDGWCKVWEADTSESASPAEPSPVASYNTTCRLTSVTFHVPPEKRWPPEQAADLAAEAAERAAAAAERAADAAERAAHKVARAAGDPGTSGTKRKRNREGGGEEKLAKKRARHDASGSEKKVKKADKKAMKGSEKSKDTAEKKKGTKKGKDKVKKKGLKGMTAKPKSIKKVQKANIKGLKALSLQGKKKKTKTKSMNVLE